MSGHRTPPPHALAKLLERAQVSDSQPSNHQQTRAQTYPQPQYGQGFSSAPQQLRGGFVHQHGSHNGNRSYNYPSPRTASLMDYVQPGPENPTAVSQSSHSHAPHSHIMVPHGPPVQPQSPNYAPFQQSIPPMQLPIVPAPSFNQFVAQGKYLENLARAELPNISFSNEEYKEKEQFRARIESICRETHQQQFPSSQAILRLILYGSVQSGLAVKGSDMDIMLVNDPRLPPTTNPSDDEMEVIPRVIEKAILQSGYGARLLSKTRVPILKVCESPTEELRSALLEAREEWERCLVHTSNQSAGLGHQRTKSGSSNPGTDQELKEGPLIDLDDPPARGSQGKGKAEGGRDNDHSDSSEQKVRERLANRLEFPPSGIGIQCDIGFWKVLGIYNTQLLRCYTACDPRVRDMVLFIKSWAKRRKINTPYHGTLSSYGWVLMVLHFLINIARPPVLPNLQTDFGVGKYGPLLEGKYDVHFYDDEARLAKMAQRGSLTQNTEPLGSLLRNFFHYYSHQGPKVIGSGFRWTEEVISIRHRGGLISKAAKGWTAAARTSINGNDVWSRYLVAIECPLEHDHNVARTVMHNGVVRIRGEFRRAWSILEVIGNGNARPVGNLLDEVVPAPVMDHATFQQAIRGRSRVTPQQAQHQRPSIENKPSNPEVLGTHRTATNESSELIP